MLKQVSDVVIGDEYYNRFDTEGVLPAFDELIGGDMTTKDGEVIKGGLIAGGIYMINGAAGCGKSTAMMTIADALGQCGHRTAYVTAEEDDAKLAFDCVERLDLHHFMIGEERDFETILQSFVDNKIKVGFIDSIAEVKVPRKTLRAAGMRRDEFIADRLKKFKKHGITLFLINHLTKSGDYKGSSSILHDIDVMLWLVHADQEIYSEDKRDMYASKNRFGRTNHHVVVSFDTDGYDFSENHWVEGAQNVVQSKANKHDLKRRLRIENLKKWFADGNPHFTIDDHESFDMRRAAFAAFVKEMEGKDIVTRSGKDGRKILYTLSGAEETSSDDDEDDVEISVNRDKITTNRDGSVTVKMSDLVA
jgi:hypothetical protein